MNAKELRGDPHPNIPIVARILSVPENQAKFFQSRNLSGYKIVTRPAAICAKPLGYQRQWVLDQTKNPGQIFMTDSDLNSVNSWPTVSNWTQDLLCPCHEEKNTHCPRGVHRLLRCGSRQATYFDVDLWGMTLEHPSDTHITGYNGWYCDVPPYDGVGAAMQVGTFFVKGFFGIRKSSKGVFAPWNVLEDLALCLSEHAAGGKIGMFRGARPMYGQSHLNKDHAKREDWQKLRALLEAKYGENTVKNFHSGRSSQNAMAVGA